MIIHVECYSNYKHYICLTRGNLLKQNVKVLSYLTISFYASLYSCIGLKKGYSLTKVENFKTLLHGNGHLTHPFECKKANLPFPQK